jgi:hypothetical protein
VLKGLLATIVKTSAVMMMLDPGRLRVAQKAQEAPLKTSPSSHVSPNFIA